MPVHHSNEIAQHEACHGHPPARYWLHGAHYRSKLVFSWSALAAAQTALGRLRRAYAGLPVGGAADPAYRERMLAELNDDLNTPRALALAWDILKSALPGAVRKATLGWLDGALGLGLDAWAPAAQAAPAAVPPAILNTIRPSPDKQARLAENDATSIWRRLIHHKPRADSAPTL